MLADHSVTDRPSRSARVFRTDRPVPPLFHRQCGKHLYVLSGCGTFWMGDAGSAEPLGPGRLLVFDRDTVHAMPELTERLVVFLAIDTPREVPATSPS